MGDSTPVVVSLRGMYLGADDSFTAHTVEDARVFPTYRESINHMLAVHRQQIQECQFDFLAGAVARDDQEYQDQLRDLRG